MALSIVQSAGNATTANSPTTITVTTAATTAGTTLLAICIVEGSGGPGISSLPAGFATIDNTGAGSETVRTGILVNNAGGLTSFVFNLSGTTFGAVAWIIELSDTPQPSVLGHTASGSGVAFPTAVNGLQALQQAVERWFIILGHNTAQAFAVAPGAPFTQIVGSPQTSTLGTNNVEGRVYTADIANLQVQAAATLAGATDCTGSVIRMTNSAGKTIAISPVGSVGNNGYSGAGGGPPG